MNGSSRTKSVFTHRGARLFFLTFVGPAGLAQVPAAADPNQAVLLDGSTDSSAVFFVAFTDNGLQFSIVIPPVPCPAADHVPQAGLFQGSLPLAAVFHPGQFDGRGFVVSPPLVAKTLPLNLQGLWDDCDVVEHFSQVLVYLDQVNLDAADLIPQIENCVQDARSAHCLLVEVIENAEIGVHHHAYDDTLGTGMLPGMDSRECVDFLAILESMPQTLDSMEENLSTCETQVSRMNKWRVKILADGHLKMSSTETRDDALAFADKMMSRAEEQLVEANEKLSQINQLKAQFVLRDVEQSCAECDESPREGPLIPLSGAVTMQTSRTPLDRYVTAFQVAARDTADPNLALRLSDLALRLEEIPDGRVLHLTFASTSAIGQDYLALQRADAPDDGISPLIVVLTALNEDPDPPLPPMNAADERLLFDGFRAFLLRVGCTTPGCIEAIPAVSKWGLVVMTLLLLLTGIKIMLDRRQPEHG